MSKFRLGIIGSSKKEDERRYPIHPEHLCQIPELVRRQLIFEQGYGEPFNFSDAEIAGLTGGIASRHELLANIGSVIIAKPVLADLQELRKGGILWGYTHCVQQREITQAAIHRKLSVIAFEDMFSWTVDGQMGRHTFYRNNEMAGYCAVLHALQLKGIDGNYGNPRKTLIFSFGAVSRGAICALQAHGFRNITVCTRRPAHEINEKIDGCHYVKVRAGNKDQARMLIVEPDGTERPLTDLISGADIIINGTLQDTKIPTQFLTEAEGSVLKPNSLIVDISCDEGMGFFFAKPTTFAEPMFKYRTTDYYAVDHTPSYLWESATRLISSALIEYLPTFLEGLDSQATGLGFKNNGLKNNSLKSQTIRKSINIERGVIQNKSILSFQHREMQYPHCPINRMAEAV